MVTSLTGLQMSHRTPAISQSLTKITNSYDELVRILVLKFALYGMATGEPVGSPGNDDATTRPELNSDAMMQLGILKRKLDKISKSWDSVKHHMDREFAAVRKRQEMARKIALGDCEEQEYLRISSAYMETYIKSEPVKGLYRNVGAEFKKLLEVNNVRLEEKFKQQQEENMLLQERVAALEDEKKVNNEALKAYLNSLDIATPINEGQLGQLENVVSSAHIAVEANSTLQHHISGRHLD